MKKFLGTTCILLAFALMVFWFSSKTSDSSKTITVAQFGDLLLYMPLYIAQEEGLFSKQGLKVNVVSTGGDDKTYAAVISGDAQFGIADPTFVAIAAERGKRGKVIGTLINGMPNYGVATTRVAPITSPMQLEGKVVATVPAPSTSYALMRALYESAGLQPKIRQVAPAGLLATLKAGEADYALLIEPWVSALELSGGSVVFSLNDYYKEFALTGVTASQEFLNKGSDTPKRFLTALAEGARLFYEDPDLALKVARKKFPQETSDSLQAGLERMRKDKIYPKDLTTTKAAWEAAIRVRRAAGDLQNATTSMEDYVSNILMGR